MNRKLARRVAREHGVSVSEVRRGIQEAIDHAYRQPNYHARKVNSTGAVPTADEFISYVKRESKKRVG